NQLSARMKELRYAVKRGWVNYSQLRAKVDAEFKEKDDFPNRIRSILGNAEDGVSNGQGWVYAGFIEDAAGDLRPQNYEELVFCIGCHSGIGGNRDGIFSFARKFETDSYQQGWYHWSQKGLGGVPEKVRSDGEFEYSFYLRQNGSGNEFRSNQEVQARFYDDEGQLRENMLERLHDDIAVLLFASKERAKLLNKAYRVIVQEQSFVKGRDAIVTPVVNVHEQVNEDQPTEIIDTVIGY
ncbi:MAG: hypothetical protein MI754_08445, partial [Chromatiales bacterium]|nr:hypothetical protein [Chromatiales bacterium]